MFTVRKESAVQAVVGSIVWCPGSSWFYRLVLITDNDCDLWYYYRAWIARRVKLDQCLEKQLFIRECEQAEMWMAVREAKLTADAVDGDTVDAIR